MCIYSYTVLTNFYNIFTIIWQSALFIGLFFLLFFFYCTPILLVLFFTFLLNIYMCIYSYTDTTHSYKHKCTNSNVVQCFGLFNPCALFISPFCFFRRCCLCFFVFFFKYLLFICAYIVTLP